MGFIIRYLMLIFVTIGFLLIPMEKWGKYNRRIISGYFLITGFIFLFYNN